MRAARRVPVVLTGLALVAWSAYAPATAGAAATFTWSGAGATGDWSEAANWAGGVAPSGAGLTLVFPSGPTQQTTVDDLGGTASVAALEFDADGYSTSGDALSPFSITVAAGAHATVADDLALSTADLIVATGDASAALTLTGAISGGYGVQATGSGTVTLGGTAANTNTGDDNALQSATLVLHKPDGTAATAGSVFAGADFAGTATVRWLAADQLGDTTKELGVVYQGTLDLNGHDESAGLVILNDGTLTTGSGTLTDSGDIYNNNTAGTISGHLVLTAASHIIGEANGDNNLDISAALTGTGPIDKTGGGTLTLDDACGYTGTLTVSGGTVDATNGYGGGVTLAGGSFIGTSNAPCAPADTGVPTISGTTTVGETLTADPGSWSGSPDSYAYQWQRCTTSNTASCAPITGATDSTYQLVADDQDAWIAVAVTAHNSAGESQPASSTTTGPVAAGPDAPAAHTGSTVAGQTTGHSATLLGIVDGNGLDTAYRFQYGTDTGYGTNTAWQDAGPDNLDVVGQSVDGLSAGTVYHYRLVAKNADGVGYGTDHTLRTLGAYITPTGVTDDNGHHATINAVVNDTNEAATYQISYTGPDDVTHTTASANLPASASDQNVSVALTGLQATSTYDYTIEVTDADGTVSATAQFTTVAYAGLANDDMYYAQTLSGTSGSVDGTTVGATAEPGEPAHGGLPATHSVWYRISWPTGYAATFWTTGTTDTTMSLYAGTPGDYPSLSAKDENDDDASGLTSTVSTEAGGNTTYLIAVDSATAGAFTLHWATAARSTSQTSTALGAPSGEFGGSVQLLWTHPVSGLTAAQGQVGVAVVGGSSYYFTPVCHRTKDPTSPVVDCRYDWSQSITGSIKATAFPTFGLNAFKAALPSGFYDVTPTHARVAWPGPYGTPTNQDVFAPVATALPSEPGVVMKWPVVTASSAFGGSYIQSNTQGATATLHYSGTSVTLYVVTGPKFGQAKLYLDGTYLRTVDLSATSLHYGVAQKVSAANAGAHTVTVQVLGKRGANGPGTAVALDAAKVDSNTRDDRPNFAQSWRITGTAATATDPGEVMALDSRGDQFEVTVGVGPSGGQVSCRAVASNGTVLFSSPGNIDTYAATAGTKTVPIRLYTNDTSVRTVTFTVLETRNASSTGHTVTIQKVTYP